MMVEAVSWPVATTTGGTLLKRRAKTSANA